MTDICDLTATELLRAYATRSLSPVEATEAVLARAEAIQPDLNAFCRIDGDRAIEAARRAERAFSDGTASGSLVGLPISIKDVVPVEGWVLGRGSRLSDGAPPAATDAPTVARLREAGAILFASTTTCEGGWKAVTDSPRTGVTRSPLDPSLTPGGSSGGAAAAVASGAGPIGLGTDGGGSVRIPSSFTGLFGLKPSYGRLPQFPIGPHYGNLAHQGPMTRCVDDAILLLRTASGRHTLDSDTLPGFRHDEFDAIGQPLDGVTIGVTPDFGFMPVEVGVADVFAAVPARLRELGATVVEVPRFEDWRPAYRTIWSAGAFQALRSVDADRRHLVDPGYLRVAAAGERVSLPEYLDAQMFRVSLRQRLGQLHESMDFVVSPSVAVAPFAAGVEKPEGPFADWLDWAGFSLAFNMTGQPAASQPFDLDASGLPVGIQIVGRPFDDVGVLRVAKAVETASERGRTLPSILGTRSRATKHPSPIPA